MEPTLAGFVAFIANVMGISTTVLPAGSPVIAAAYYIALEKVNPTLLVVPCSSPSYPTIYALAVYNLAGALLVEYAPDIPDAPNVTGSKLPFFANLRQNFNINGFVGGVVQSSADETTSETLVVPEQMKNLTFSDLQMLKTPWGRTYLGFAQAVGTNWGIS